MCVRHHDIVYSRHTGLHRRNVSWWLRMAAVCENRTSSSSQWVRDSREIIQGEIKLFQHCHVWKRHTHLSPPLTQLEMCRSKHEKPGLFCWDEKRKHIKYSLCFLYRHVNMRVSACSIFSTDLQNDERGWCKSYNCCSVLERVGAERREGRSGSGKRGERQTDRHRQREAEMRDAPSLFFSGSIRFRCLNLDICRYWYQSSFSWVLLSLSLSL